MSKFSGIIRHIWDEMVEVPGTTLFKRNIVLVYGDKHKKFAAFEAWNKSVGLNSNLKVGQVVTITFEPESKEQEGKWFTRNKISSIAIVSEK